MRRIVLLVVSSFLLLTVPVAAQEDIELQPYQTDNFQTVVPAGWQEVQTGVFLGSPAADLILVAQNTPDATRAEVLESLLPQLALTETPEADSTISTDTLEWDIYNLEVALVSAGVDMALAEDDSGTYLILLQTPIADRDVYYEPVFLPAVNEFTTATDTDSATDSGDGETDRETFVLDDFYSVPIPTNWTVDDTNDGYVHLYSPDELIGFYIVIEEGAVADADEAETLVNEAWSVVAPELERAELNEITEPPADPGIDAAYEFSYNIPGEAPVVYAASVLVADDVNYVRLLQADRDEASRRSAQIGVVATGFEVSSVEQTDLSDVEPLLVDEDLITEWEAFIERVMSESEIPGMAIAVVQDGEIVLQRGYGVRELDTDAPVTPQTMFAIASTTKTMTTGTMAALVDAGLMDWDTPVTDVWDEFSLANPEVTEQLTLRNLVCACVGVERRDLELFFNLDDTPQEFIGALANFELFTDFGEAFQYSNQMIAAGGYLSAIAAGGSVETMRDDYISEVESRLWQPLEMTDSTFSLDTAAAYDELATPHNINLATLDIITIPLEYERSIEITGPAGGVFSTLDDMTDYLMLYMNNGATESGTQLISQDNLDVLWSPQIDVNADTQYGLGWFISEIDGVPVLSHAGNAVGYTSEFAFLPEAGLGVVMLSNLRAANEAHNLIFQRLIELVYDQPDESTEQLEFLIERATAQEEQLMEWIQPVDTAEFDALAGRYENDTLGTLELLVNDAGQAQVQIGNITMNISRFEAPTAVEGAYILTTPPLSSLTFSFDEDGQLLLEAGATDFVFEPVME